MQTAPRGNYTPPLSASGRNCAGQSGASNPTTADRASSSPSMSDLAALRIALLARPTPAGSGGTEVRAGASCPGARRAILTASTDAAFQLADLLGHDAQ
jgi:hypothetical protein